MGWEDTIEDAPEAAASPTPHSDWENSIQDAVSATPSYNFAPKVPAAAAKALDYMGGGSRALLSTIAGALSGKKLTTGQELLDAINPTTSQQFPHWGEIAKRAGIPEGGKLSDLLPIYAKPGTPHNAFQPEVGGALDPTLRGTGGFAADVATDPLTYLSIGGSALAKEAALKSASKQALEAAAGKSPSQLLDAAVAPSAAITKGVQALPGGSALQKLAQWPSDAITALGKKSYSAAVRPVEYEGAKYGKTGVADTLFDAGVKTPFGLQAKAEDAVQTLITARDKLLQDATNAGAQASMVKATQKARQTINEIRATRDPNGAEIADAMEAKLNEYTNLEKGTPAIPPTRPVTKSVPSSFVDESGNPIMVDHTTPGLPGFPAIPGLPVTPVQSSAMKSSLYSSMPSSAYAEAATTGTGRRVVKGLAKGLKEETENSVGRTLGPQAGLDVSDLNDAAGKLLGTKRSQLSVGHRANVQSDKLGQLNMSDMLMGEIGSKGGDDLLGMIKGIALNKLRQAAQLGSMPTGYLLRSLGEGRLSGPTLDIAGRQTVIHNPWALTNRRLDDEQEKGQ